jgi:hypothetical protein
VIKRHVLPRSVHLAALLAGLSLAGCVPALYPNGVQPAAPRDVRADSDGRQIEQMETARSKANATGSAIDATTFAVLLGTLHQNKVDERRNLPPTRVDEAATCLDRARAQRPEEAHELLASKGELYIQFGRNDEGFAALRESMAARPNVRAFALLGKAHKETNDLAALERMCRKTLPAMKEDDDRYFVLDKCIEFSGASTVEGGLRWASAKDVEFYRQKRVEVDRRREAFGERKRAEQEREQEQWRARDREREAEHRERDSCLRQCESVRSLCSSNCGSTGGCSGRCLNDSVGCKRSCR